MLKNPEILKQRRRAELKIEKQRELNPEELRQEELRQEEIMQAKLKHEELKKFNIKTKYDIQAIEELQRRLRQGVQDPKELRLEEIRENIIQNFMKKIKINI